MQIRNSYTHPRANTHPAPAACGWEIYRSVFCSLPLTVSRRSSLHMRSRIGCSAFFSRLPIDSFQERPRSSAAQAWKPFAFGSLSVFGLEGAGRQGRVLRREGVSPGGQALPLPREGPGCFSALTGERMTQPCSDAPPERGLRLVHFSRVSQTPRLLLGEGAALSGLC